MEFTLCVERAVFRKPADSYKIAEEVPVYIVCLAIRDYETHSTRTVEFFKVNLKLHDTRDIFEQNVFIESANGSVIA